MSTESSPNTSWYHGLTRYHWFVFIVCCLGWGLDCFDQQIFNLMRNPALANLMGLDPTHANVTKMGGLATSIMLLGWGFGGILFGVMADKFGRARMMIITILFYAVFTGLCGLATNWWDFFLYRFLCGMGVGGQFAAGVTLLAETMPDNARPKSLGLLQIFAAFCNLCAASLALCGGIFEGWGYFSNFPLWRSLFLVGFIPALLAFVVMRRLEEPKAWKEAIASGGIKKAGSIPDLFRNPRWRYNVIIGMCLATCGVIGLWGIGFFSVDLTRTTFRVAKNQEARERGDVETLDFELIRMLAANPKEFLPIAQKKKITPQSFVGNKVETDVGRMIYPNDPGIIYQTIAVIVENQHSLERLNSEVMFAALVNFPAKDDRLTNLMILTATLADIPMTDKQREVQRLRWERILDQPPRQMDKAEFERLASAIAERSQSISSYVTFWGSITSLFFNLGAVIGTWGITLAAERWGRRIAFTMFFGASFFMTILVFLTMDTELEVLIMQPILGFCILSLFGGYAIYFPELFPTRLRSTAISFCYNIARFVSALGPAGLGMLTAYVFHDTDEPIRWAGAAMSVTFIFGIIFAWLGPETKGKPLPEE